MNTINNFLKENYIYESGKLSNTIGTIIKPLSTQLIKYTDCSDDQIINNIKTILQISKPIITRYKKYIQNTNMLKELLYEYIFKTTNIKEKEISSLISNIQSQLNYVDIFKQNKIKNLNNIVSLFMISSSLAELKNKNTDININILETTSKKTLVNLLKKQKTKNIYFIIFILLKLLTSIIALIIIISNISQIPILFSFSVLSILGSLIYLFYTYHKEEERLQKT